MSVFQKVNVLAVQMSYCVIRSGQHLSASVIPIQLLLSLQTTTKKTLQCRMLTSKSKILPVTFNSDTVSCS